MKANVKYFGMIAEKTNCESETIDLNLEKNNLREFFEKRYPSIKEMNYKIAVNQEFTEVITETNELIEIALLPPFAGG